MSEKIIRDALGQIGDNLIVGAAEDAVRRHFSARRKKNGQRLYLAVLAASLCIVVVLAFPILRLIGGSLVKSEGSGGSDESSQPACGIGERVETPFGAVEIIVSDEYSASFILQKSTDATLYFTIYGITTDGTRKLCATTNPDYASANNMIVYTDKLIITVDGAAADSLPSAPGEYIVAVDFSELIDGGNSLESTFIISGFGSFSW